MEQKSKFIIIALAGLLIAAGAGCFLALSAKKTLEVKYGELSQNYETLQGDFNRAKEAERQATSKLQSLSKEVDRITALKNELQAKFDIAVKERDLLVAKLKSQPAQAAVQQPAAQAVSMPAATDAYWGGIVKAKTDLEMQLASIREEYKAAQIANEQLQREKNALNVDIANLVRERDELKRQLDYNLKMMDSISCELVREKNDRMQTQETLKKLTNTNELLTRELKGINNRKIELDKKVQSLQEDKVELNNKINDMQCMLTDKITQVDALRDDLVAVGTCDVNAQTPPPIKQNDQCVQLAPIVIKPQGAQAPAEEQLLSSAEGSVLSINKENNFVIIDIGATSGVKEGDAFKVYRDGAPIADVEVIQTRDNISACDIKKEVQPIKISDIVR